MAHDRNESPALDFILEVERFYAALMQAPAAFSGLEPNQDADHGLGGKLLYAGELDPRGSAFIVAANIAGAASLSATADAPAQKQAVRDGVVDFLVTSLDEALRILKNEIRKRETVAVCVASSPLALEQQMLERGVLPDLLSPPVLSNSPAPAGQILVTWRVATAPAQWLPKLDAIALDCLPATPDHSSRSARRWLRLSPRYLGRLAQGTRVLRCESNVANEIVDRIQGAVDRREIPAEVHIAITG